MLGSRAGGAPKNKYGIFQKLLDLVKRNLPRYPVSKIVRSRAFKQEEPSIDADIVVFGHTHYPEVNTFGDQHKNHRIKRLVNTGSWIEQQTDAIRYDTFVYLDHSRGRLYKWHLDGDVEELERWSNLELSSPSNAKPHTPNPTP
ncbi:MAG: hypothetical protein ACXV6K_07425 [Halobacteriota archaeon]